MALSFFDLSSQHNRESAHTLDFALNLSDSVPSVTSHTGFIDIAGTLERARALPIDPIRAERWKAPRQWYAKLYEIPSDFDVSWFWSHVDRSGGMFACWPWTARKHPAGYGETHIRGVGSQGAHRVALMLARPGELTTDRPETLHSCDNKPCCNPAHLSAGTRSQNMTEYFARTGRYQPLSNGAGIYAPEQNISRLIKGERE